MQDYLLLVSKNRHQIGLTSNISDVILSAYYPTNTVIKQISRVKQKSSLETRHIILQQDLIE